MFRAVRESWNGLPPIAKGGVGLTVAVIGGIVINRQVNKYNKKQELKKAKALFDASQQKISVTDGKGNVVTVTINTAVAATKVYDAIHNNDIFGWTEDETAIVNTLKTIPQAYIPDVINNYKNLYGKNMQQEVISALDQDEWDKVEYLFQ